MKFAKDKDFEQQTITAPQHQSAYMLDWISYLKHINHARHFMRSFLILIVALLLNFCYGQEFSYPSINQTGKTVQDFVPAGWTILDTATGDLNRDKLNDVAIILQYKDSVTIVGPHDVEDTVVTQPRMLIIVFKNSANNKFYLAEKTNSFILNHDNPTMEDPYAGLTIHKGVLQIDFHIFHNMGSWYITNASYKFRFQNNQFELIGAEYSSMHRATHDFENYSYNFLTKKRSLIKGNDNKGTKKTHWKPVKIATLKTLKTFKQPFTWEVEKDFYL